MARLRNPGLRERHWEMISEKTGIALRPDPTLTLTKLVELKISQWDDEIEAVSVVATQEYSLEKALDKMVAEWKPLTLDAVAYKETVLIRIHVITPRTHLLYADTLRAPPPLHRA